MGTVEDWVIETNLYIYPFWADRTIVPKIAPSLKPLLIRAKIVNSDDTSLEISYMVHQKLAKFKNPTDTQSQSIMGIGIFKKVKTKK